MLLRRRGHRADETARERAGGPPLTRRERRLRRHRRRRLQRSSALFSVVFLSTVAAGWANDGLRSTSVSARPVAAAGAEPEAPTAAPVTVPPEPACTSAPLAERAAAVLLIGMPHSTVPTENLADDATARIGVGGVLLTDVNVQSERQVRTLVEGLRERSRRPLIVAVDEEGGRVSSVAGIARRGPSARRLGRQDAADIREAGRDVGETLAGLGADMALAPVADLDGGRWDGVIGDRSFGDDPGDVAGAAVAFAAGLRDAGVTPVAKHFPGHPSDGDSHDGTVESDVTRAELVQRDLVPFQALVDAGVPVVMMNHVTYTELGPRPASLEPAAYRLLRDTGFDGVAMTDSIAMGAISNHWTFPQAAVESLRAGADMVLATHGWWAQPMVDAIAWAVATGDLPEARLDEAVTRVLRLRGEDPASMVCPPPAGE